MSITPPAKRDAAPVLGAVAVLVLPVGLIASKGLAPLFAIAAVAALAVHLAGRRAWPPVPLLPAAVLAAFAGLAAASALWSLTPAVSLKTTASLIATLAGGLVLAGAAARLPAARRRAVETAVIVGGFIGFTYLGIELASGGAVTRFLYGLVGRAGRLPHNAIYALNPGASVAALYLWPWAVALRRRLPAAATLSCVAAGFVAVAFSQAETPALAVALGAVVLAADLAIRRRLVPALLAVVVALGVLSAPWAAARLPDPATEGSEVAFLPNSGLHRLAIWRVTAARIEERPLLGHGFDTARALYGPKDRVTEWFRRGGAEKPWSVTVEPIPLHPHNGILQVWLELGVPGAVILLGFLLALVAAIRDRSAGRGERAAALGLFTTGLAISAVSYGAWQSWWLGGLWLVAGLAVAVLGAPPGASPEAHNALGSGPAARQQPGDAP